jgi:precorrin-3B synthase
MASGDGWIVRVRPDAGQLSRRQAAGIAALAAEHGNGLVELTRRANLQLRGVSPGSYPALIDGLRALDLVDADPAAEQRRNIVVTPFWVDGDATLPLARALADALAAADAPDLPAKFGFALDCGDTAVLRATPATVRIERDEQGLLVRADGQALLARATVHDAVATAMELARWLVRSGPDQPPPAPFGAAPAQVRVAPAPRPGPAPGGWLVAAAFGQLPADTLARLAEQGALRLTPWRMLLVEGAAEAPRLADLVTDPFDPLLRVVACSGNAGCPQGAAATRPLARTLAPLVPASGLLHISGCAKGCAHSAPALTLVATPAGYDLVRHGKASAVPDLRALPADALPLHLASAWSATTPQDLPHP